MTTKNCRVTVNPKTGQIFTQQLDENGKPLLDKNGKTYGFIRIAQTKIDMSFAYQNGGIRDVSALKAISTEAWNKAKPFYTPDMEIGGKVRVLETLEAGLPGYQIKRAGQGVDGQPGEPLTLAGSPIYRKTEHVEDVTLEDILVKHDNVITRIVQEPIVANNAAKRTLN